MYYDKVALILIYAYNLNKDSKASHRNQWSLNHQFKKITLGEELDWVALISPTLKKYEILKKIFDRSKLRITNDILI